MFGSWGKKRAISANDPLTGERKWSVDMDIPGFSCVLTTGGSLVFNGVPMGKLRAHDADTGKVEEFQRRRSASTATWSG